MALSNEKSGDVVKDKLAELNAAAINPSNTPPAPSADRDLKLKELELQERSQLYEKWHKYESIAMHFNDLIIRFRTQSLAGLAAISTLVVTVLGDKIVVQGRSIALFLLIAFLTVCWRLIWILDVEYYQELLMGAVDAIMELEAASGGELRMSTKIEARFGTRKIPQAPATFYRWIFYSLLFACTVTGYFVIKDNVSFSTPAATAPATTATTTTTTTTTVTSTTPATTGTTTATGSTTSANPPAPAPTNQPAATAAPANPSTSQGAAPPSPPAPHSP